MKKSLLFAVIASIYLTGTFGVFTSFYQQQHKLQFQKATVEANEIEVEKKFFTDEEYNSILWTEEGREFDWHDKMYDVNKIERTANGYWIYCENDDFEELLISLVRSLKKELDGSSQNLNPQPQFFQAILTYLPSSVASIRMEKVNSKYLSSYQPLSSSIPSPPPKSLLTTKNRRIR